MIKKFEYIRDFGIYKNFTWNNITSIEEFNIKNIIYGWNYSGKTTFSRIFSSLRDKVIDKDYKAASFKITTDKGNFDNNNLASFPYKILVFNSLYVKENLRWDFDENINAIFFEVGDNAKYTDKILELEKLINEINGTEGIVGKKDKFQESLNQYNQFEESIFTEEAKKIKNDCFSSLIEFNKGHLKTIKNKVINDLGSFIIKDKELNSLSKTVKIEEPKIKIDEIIFERNIQEIINEVNAILISAPPKDEIIEILDKNVTSYDWVKLGLKINNQNEKCLFCDNTISEERITLLNSYFENQASKLKENCVLIFEKLNIEEDKIDRINFPLSLNDLNEGFQDEYIKAKKEFDKEVTFYKRNLKKVKSELNKKLNESIYSSTTIINDYDLDSFNNKIIELNDVINRNNTFTEKFPTIINAERDRYKSHLVALFLKKSKFSIKHKKSEKAGIEILKLNEKVKKYRTEINRLNSLKESDKEGCAQFNSFVQSFLSREDIEIKLNEETKKFNLIRDSIIASNLSEGEKMAISFSHFLVTLKSIEQKNELKDHIIFIDDPISSLDGNHIFQINSLLKDIFFHKVVNPKDSKQLMWDSKCLQLFISTHNFEFFNLLKELPISNKKESKYFITRKINESVIEKLPNVYDSYSSEYHYLFSEIVDFENDVNKNSSPKLLLMPNILRRFIKMYTLTKYPSNDEVDGRADEVFGKVKSKRILKPLHYFSHFNNIDRIGKQSELIADVGNACHLLIEFIKTDDAKHYKALLNSIS